MSPPGHDGGPETEVPRPTTTTTQVDTDERTARCSDLTTFVHALYGDGRGRWFTPLGHGPYWREDGQYDHEHFEGSFSHAWPHQTPEKIAELLVRKSKTIDVYMCVSLMKAGIKTCKKAQCASCCVVWSDWDGDPADTEEVLDIVRALDGFAVSSGTPGHLHCYLPLAESVDADQAERLCRAFQAHLPPGSDKGKHTVENLVRPPGTLNHKSVAATGSPSAVRWLIRPSGTRWDPATLAEHLGAVNGKPCAAGDPETLRFETLSPVDLAYHPLVQKALDNVTNDRSDDTYRVVAACKDDRLTLDETRSVVASRADLAERLAERTDDDVQTCWLKVIDRQQKDVQYTGPVHGDPASNTNREPGPESESSDDATVDWHTVSGGAFIFDRPDTIPAVWGEGDEVLWAEGESLMIVGPQGLGKTTLEGMLIGALLGLNDGVVLGLPIADTGQRILLLAMDRPHQIGRSLKRQFTEDTDRQVLDGRLVIRPGPPPGDLAKNPALMVAMAVDLGCGVVFVDSVKDAAIGLSDDEVGASYNRARQHVTAAGIQHCDLHHTKKLTDGTIADAYGSTWLTSGCGSVIMLTGEPGDPLVGFRHAKIPAAEVGPFRLSHDQTRGLLAIDYQVDLIDLVRQQEANGITAMGAAGCMFNTETPTRAQCEKARRKLDALVDAGLLSRMEGTTGGPRGGTPTSWFLA